MQKFNEEKSMKSEKEREKKKKCTHNYKLIYLEIANLHREMYAAKSISR